MPLALLAAGDTAAPLRALIYLACTQRQDGGFHQNFWINGEAYWQGIQLDETAFPVLLAGICTSEGAPGFRSSSDGTEGSQLPHPARPRHSTGTLGREQRLLALDAGSKHRRVDLAAAFAREAGRQSAAEYLEEYADFLEAHIEAWTVTTEGTLVAGIPRHFIRIHPVDVADPHADEDANHGVLLIRNQPPGASAAFPAKDVVDAGFLELVRYGVRAPGNPLIEDSLRVVDAILKVDTPLGLAGEGTITTAMDSGKMAAPSRVGEKDMPGRC